jgi:hypothetical protein
MLITCKNSQSFSLPPKLAWHGGPPPEVGWWPAGMYRDPATLRWWDGEAWSHAVCCEEDDAEEAAKAAEGRTSYQDCVEWTDRWWLVPGYRVEAGRKPWPAVASGTSPFASDLGYLTPDARGLERKKRTDAEVTAFVSVGHGGIELGLRGSLLNRSQ